MRIALHDLNFGVWDLLVHVEFGYAQCSHILEPNDVREGSHHKHIILRTNVFEDVHQVVVD